MSDSDRTPPRKRSYSSSSCEKMSRNSSSQYDSSETPTYSSHSPDKRYKSNKDSQVERYYSKKYKYKKRSKKCKYKERDDVDVERMSGSDNGEDNRHVGEKRHEDRTDRDMSGRIDSDYHNYYSSEDNRNTSTDFDKESSDSMSDSYDDGMKSDPNTDNGEEDLSEEIKVLQMNPQLREFDILDDLEESDQEDDEYHQSNSDSSDYETEEDEEPTVEDVDAMLEEGLPDKFKEPEKKEHVIKLRRKVVLEEIGHDHFDLLPEGWIQIMHSSGMPVYLHQKSRVCTMARPYYLGPGSSRNHKIPLSAIPCLQYRRALEVEKKNKEEKEKNSEQNKNQPEIQLMAARIETSEENEAAQSLEAMDLREYCKSLFNFKTITLIPFKSWADRRKYVRMTKDLKKRQRPSLPGGTKLLKFPTQNTDGTNSRSKGEWIINPNGKSYVCILHEYVQHALKKHPKYQFKELENPATPYSATVFIGDMQYSVGMGASKKQAKVEAAKAALEVLIPEMKEKIERDGQFGMRSGIAQRSQTNDISIFDQIRVEDPRVAEFCAKTTEPPPYAILLTCLSRNLGLGEIKVHYEMNSKKHKEDEYTMVVGDHKATVVCKNKRDGKQRAAQAILQALHPNVTHWGSLLRMYGNRSIKSVKEKKQEEQEITRLQSKASLNQPNFAILEKLRVEMVKLREKRDAMKAKGKFTPPDNVILPSLSSTDLNKINFSHLKTNQDAIKDKQQQC
nr:microprocessor complex subunit DGCR8 [Scaphoideus titanus]